MYGRRLTVLWRTEHRTPADQSDLCNVNPVKFITECNNSRTYSIPWCVPRSKKTQPTEVGSQNTVWLDRLDASVWLVVGTLSRRRVRGGWTIWMLRCGLLWAPSVDVGSEVLATAEGSRRADFGPYPSFLGGRAYTCVMQQ